MFPAVPLVLQTAGRLASTAAVGAVGAAAYVHTHQHLGRWLAGVKPPLSASMTLAHLGVRASTDGQAEHPGQRLLAEMDRRQAALLERLTALSTSTMKELKTAVGGVRGEFQALRADVQAQLAGHHSEALALEELVRQLASRLDTVEQSLKLSGDGEVKASRARPLGAVPPLPPTV
jgi:hypothetical protein